jgi:hypothetical protein
MTTKVLIITEHGEIVNVLTNGETTVYHREIGTHKTAKMESCQLSDETFDAQLGEQPITQKPRWP